MPDINNVEDPDDPWKKIEEHYDGKFVPKWVDKSDKPVKPKRKSYTQDKMEAYLHDTKVHDTSFDNSFSN